MKLPLVLTCLNLTPMRNRFNVDDLLKSGYVWDAKSGSYVQRRAAKPEHTQLQEQQNDRKDQRQAIADNGSKKEKSDGQDYRPIEKCEVEFIFQVSDRRLRDLDGMASTVMDCLVRAGIIKDDNRFVVTKVTTWAQDCPKGKEGVKICITPSTT